MIRVLVWLAVTALSGCDAPPRTVAGFAAAPEEARAAVAECEGGRRRVDCDAARAGLAEARRRDRMAAYERAF